MKRLLLFSFAGAIILGAFQQRRLSRLHDDIARLEPQRPAVAQRSEAAVLPFRTVQRSRLDLHSTAGQETIPEMNRLLTVLGRKMLERSPVVSLLRAAGPEDPDLLRIQTLLAGLGSAAAEEFFGAMPDSPTKWAALNGYSMSNPEQALFFFFRAKSEEKPHLDPISCFQAWAFLDPDGALDWYHQTPKDGPVVTSETMRLYVAMARSRVDPAGSVSDLLPILRGKPPQPTKQDIWEISQRFYNALRDEDERISFFAALKLPPGETDEIPYLSGMRNQFYSWVESPLSKKTFAEASPVIDGFSPAEKLKFAKTKSPESCHDLQDAAAWVNWQLSIDLPAGQKHPLIQHADNQAGWPGSPQPEWLKTLPPGDLRNVATSAYVERLARQNPALASRWIEEIPDGPGRQKLAAEISTAWEKSDPAAAADSLKREGEEGK